jgi:hypothetical protein
MIDPLAPRGAEEMRCSPPRRPKIQITARNRHGRACPGHPRGPAATGRAIDSMSHTSPANPDWSSRSAALSRRAARLALNGGGNGLVEFHIDEALETVALGEAFREPLAMLIGAAADVGSHARYRERRSGGWSRYRPSLPASAPATTAWVAGTSPAMTVKGFEMSF